MDLTSVGPWLQKFFSEDTTNEFEDTEEDLFTQEKGLLEVVEDMREKEAKSEKNFKKNEIEYCCPRKTNEKEDRRLDIGYCGPRQKDKTRAKIRSDLDQEIIRDTDGYLFVYFLSGL